MGVLVVLMNQGDSGSEEKDNGPGQEGALFLRFHRCRRDNCHTRRPSRTIPPSDTPSPRTPWIAMFFRFQSQSINTDSEVEILQAG